MQKTILITAEDFRVLHDGTGSIVVKPVPEQDPKAIGFAKADLECVPVRSESLGHGLVRLTLIDEPVSPLPDGAHVASSETKHVKVRIRNGTGGPDMYAELPVIWECGHFATHEAAPGSGSQEGGKPWYTATHRPSGKALTPLMPTEAHARTFAQWLLTLDCDWSRENPGSARLPRNLLQVREWVRARDKAPSLAMIKRHANRTGRAA